MPSTQVEAFLSPVEEQEIIEAILEAETKTSGEIRVHIEARCKGDAFERAREIFYILKMDNTKNNNGVLFYVAVNDHKFAIYGDRGMNAVVPRDFWNETKEILEVYFKKKLFKEGLRKAILKAGMELKDRFPRTAGDTNELGNEISKG